MKSLFSKPIFYLVIILCINYYTPLYSQSELSAKEKVFSYDIAVPDAPAFNLIEPEANSILRPSSVRDLTLNLSKFISPNFSLSLPKSFAIEFSPGLLINGKNLSLQQYSKNRTLYSIRLSAATKKSVEDNNRINLAIGLRLSLIDKSDLRTNQNFLKDADKIAEIINQMVEKRIGNINPEFRDSLSTNKTHIVTYTAEEQEAADNMYEKLIDKYLNNNWNKEVFDIAFATGAFSEDSTGKNIKFQRFAVWSTYGKGFGNWGQLLAGLKITAENDTIDDKYKPIGDAGMKFYIGSNAYKVYLEAFGSWADRKKPNYFLNTGGDIRLIKNLWLTIHGGLEFDNNSKLSNFKHDFSLKYGF